MVDAPSKPHCKCRYCKHYEWEIARQFQGSLVGGWLETCLIDQPDCGTTTTCEQFTPLEEQE